MSSAPCVFPQKNRLHTDEVDIVREGPDGTLVSVPCTDKYNHHYSAYMQGKAATQLDVEEARRLSPDAVGADGYLPNDPHGTPLPQWRIAQKAAQAAPAGIPHVQAFSEGVN